MPYVKQQSHFEIFHRPVMCRTKYRIHDIETENIHEKLRQVIIIVLLKIITNLNVLFTEQNNRYNTVV